jgi:hypothetical protein
MTSPTVSGKNLVGQPLGIWWSAWYRHWNIETKKFILCCGGIENSRLLLWFREKNKSIAKNVYMTIKYFLKKIFEKINLTS